MRDLAESAARKSARRGGRLPRGERREQLLEAAVRQYLGARGRASGRFRLEDRSVAGHGLVEDLRGAPWASIVQRAYEGRGG